MNFTANKTNMKNDQVNIFWEEVEKIQIRHSLFFPVSQIKYISIQGKDDNYELIFRRHGCSVKSPASPQPPIISRRCGCSDSHP